MLKTPTAARTLVRQLRQSAEQVSFTHTSTKWTQPTAGHDTGIRIYNCVARQQVPLIVRRPHFATWYACGPTVYAPAHIGHASCYVKQDLLQRTLREHFRLPLVTAMNITDVDDKIIERSRQTGEHWLALTQRYEDDFWSDLRSLGCAQPTVKLRVSEHLPQIVAFVQRLLDDGRAYGTADGSVYFAVDRHLGYGKLQRLSVADSRSPTSTADDDASKRSAADFALWKGRGGEPTASAEPHWSVPWSRIGGRPGWHIECSAMASHVFGAHIDVHAGGLDLRFPHHENEEAQSCAHHRCSQWVNYWLHTGQLHVLGDRDKMSKSLQNTIGVADLLQTYTAAEFRMLCLLSNYHNQIEFGPDAMAVARSIVQKLNTFAADCEAYVSGARPLAAFDANDLHAHMSEAERRIDTALRDNFNTAKSVEALLELVTHCNRVFKVRRHPVASSSTVAGADLSSVLAVNMLVERYRSMWAVSRTAAQPMLNDRQAEPDGHARQLELVMRGVLKARQTIRAQAVQTGRPELFGASDQIRDALREAGVQVKDNAGSSSTWTMDEAQRAV